MQVAASGVAVADLLRLFDTDATSERPPTGSHIVTALPLHSSCPPCQRALPLHSARSTHRTAVYWCAAGERLVDELEFLHGMRTHFGFRGNALLTREVFETVDTQRRGEVPRPL